MDDRKPRRAMAKPGKRGAARGPVVPNVDNHVDAKSETRRDPLTTFDPAVFSAEIEPVSASALAISTVLVDDAVLADAVLASSRDEAADAHDSASQDAASPDMASDQHMAEVDEAPAEALVVDAASINVAATTDASAEDPAASASDPIATRSAITEPAAEAAPVLDVDPSRSTGSLGFAGLSLISSQKDKIMEMSTNLGSGMNDMMSGAQDKAKEAFEKGSSMLGEVGSFTRGNVEAVVESGKILAAGLQDMSTNLVAEGRGAFEAMTADFKELAGSKTPADFFRVQNEMMRKSLDNAASLGSKNSEAMLKLVSDVFAPLSGRVNVAAEKVKMPTV